MPYIRRMTTLTRKIPRPVQTPIVCVQLIKTTWSKQSRGGPSAVLRNRVPEALPLAPLPSMAESLRYLHQHILFGEGNDFRKPIYEAVNTSDAPSLHLGCLWLTLGDGALHVFCQYQRSQGAPERHSARVLAFRLTPGEWGCVLYNGRHVDSDGYWSYNKWVYNIGLFDNPRPRVFLNTVLVKIFSQMAHLF